MCIPADSVVECFKPSPPGLLLWPVNDCVSCKLHCNLSLLHSHWCNGF